MTEKRALYHFWVKMPGGKRAHRYCIATPDGNYIGPFWSRKEAVAYAAGTPTLTALASADLHNYCSASKTMIGWVEWIREGYNPWPA